MEIQSDQIYHSKLVHLVFSSGLNPKIVNRYVETFDKYFSDLHVVANYTINDCIRIYQDPDMLRNLSKINACVQNAKKCLELALVFGTFGNYLQELEREFYPDDMDSIAKKLSSHFKFIGPVNSVAFLEAVYENHYA
ncbi:MAG TPA: hypothetical protein DCS67_03675 [Clostridiales bacterium UBA8960]|jgi:3-methyladenine DNA glycosylase Tag|nr:hypothetical protein [Clostridiales bacterium UBA8960]